MGFAAALILPAPAHAQAQYEILHAFEAAPSNPQAALLEASDGALYGTTHFGGASGFGTVFRYDLATSALTTLHSFNSDNGGFPYAGLIQGSDGALYGTTVGGGPSGGRGTVFRYDLATSSLTTLHSFHGTDGEQPYAALIQGSDGSLYGTTYRGGTSGGHGTVFRYDLATSTLTTLHSFNAANGRFAHAALIEGSDGALYGTTVQGGASGAGTVFRYDLATSTLSTLHSFNSATGAFPFAELIQGLDGALYGTTLGGGASAVGTVFRYDLATSSLTTLHTFNTATGALPYAELIQGADGAFYGTTQQGGASGAGSVFRYDLATSAFITLHSFNNANGANPYAALIQGADGALYGTTVSGGAINAGTVFRYDLATSALITLHSFSNANGANPYAGLIQGSDGALYGTTVQGGANNAGTVFRYDLATSTLTTLHSFNGSDGASPYALLVQGSDGGLYGTTYHGGATGYGTVFRYDLATSTLITLHSFDGETGALPYAALIQGAGGALYGTTSAGGMWILGTVFRYDLATSTLTRLHSFGGSDGVRPYAALLQGSDDALYGTASGGDTSEGTVFRYDLATSTLTSLHSFSGTNGANPQAALIQGSDGALFGTTREGGANNAGTVFRHDLATSTLTTLHSFNSSNGAYPSAAVFQGSDGALYGTTNQGGAISSGTVFRYDVATSTLTTLHSFNSTNGASPAAALIQGSDGAFYGTTISGGQGGGGVIFRITLTPPTDLAATKSGPTTIAPGQSLTYTIAITNNGPGTATGAAVTDALPGTLSNAAWTCTASAGSTCTPSGSGNIADSVSLPDGGTATYVLTATVGPGFTGTLTNTAFITVPAGGSDPVPGNNNSTWNTNVSRIMPTITWAAPPAITYGTPLGAAQLNATANVAGTFVYTPPAGAILDAGPHTLSLTFTPSDPVTYHTATAAVPLTVTPATPNIVWANPSPIPDGAPLTSTQLNATVVPAIAGAFVYAPPAGTILPRGPHPLSVTFSARGPAVLGGTLRFVNPPDSVSLPQTPAYYSSSAFSWELWFRADAAPTTTAIGNHLAQAMITAGDGAQCDDIYLGFGSVFTPARAIGFVVDANGGCTVRDTSPLSYDAGGFVNGTWHHVVATQDYGNQRTRLYVDGILRASKSWSGAPITRAMPMTLGRWFDGGVVQNQFRGSLDEIRFYNRELTSFEVAAHYADGEGQFGSPEAGLVGGWHFDEQSGTAVFDYSGAGRTGVLVGAPVRLLGEVAVEYEANPNYTVATRTVQIIVGDVTPPVVTVRQGDVSYALPGSLEVVDGGTLWLLANVGASSTNAVVRARSSNGSIAATHVVGNWPRAAALVGTNLWVAMYGENSVKRLRASDGALLGTFPVQNPLSLAYDGAVIWVGTAAHSVTRLSATDGSFLSSTTAGATVVKLAWDGTDMWSANFFGDSVSKLRGSDGNRVLLVPVGVNPNAVVSQGSAIWVAVHGDGKVVKLDRDTGAILGSFPMPGAPFAVAFDGTHLWAAWNGHVTKLRTADGAILGTELMDVSTSGPMLYDADSHSLWGTGANGITRHPLGDIGPAGITIEATGPLGATVAFSASAIDIVDGALAAVCDHASGSTFPLGVTPVTCTATDAAGNMGSKTFDVTVVDTTPPALTVPGSMNVRAPDPAGAIVSFAPAPSAVDRVSGAVPVTCSPASGTLFPVGATPVDCTATDGAGNADTKSFVVTVTSPEADLAVTKTDGQATAVPGRSVTYTVVVTNLGPDAATGATVADAMPAAITSASWTCAATGGGICSAGGTGSIGDTVALPANATATYTITALISPSATGSLSNDATVAAPTGVIDTSNANNTATDTDILTPEADLGISKTDGQTSAVVGQPITYTITVTSSGPSDAIGARVTDAIPVLVNGASWTCVGSGGAACASAGTGNIDDTANIPAGGSAAYTLQGTVDIGGSGTLVNVASVAAPAGVIDPAAANNTATDTDTLVDLTAPTVTVTRPNGGEILFTGTAYDITWTAADNVALGSFDVLASANGGASFTPIAGCTGLAAAARSCTWTAPGPTTTEARIRVTARDASGNQASDPSNANFTIQGASGSINVTAPNTNVTWIVGMTKQIAWSHNLGTSSAVNVEISRDAGATWSLIAAGVPNATATTGLLDWVVSGPAAAQALVRVSWTANSAVRDQGNAAFTIENGFVKVTQPDNPPPTNWSVGQTKAVKWNHNLGMSEAVDIEFSADGGATWSVVAVGVQNSGATKGTYAWTFPSAPTTLGLIRVTWNRNPAVGDVSDVVFTLH